MATCKKYGLCFDTETSNSDYKTGMALSFGLIIFNTKTYEALDSLYIEVKFDDRFKWSEEAYQVHGLSKEYLNKKGMSREDAAVEIGQFLYKYFQTENFIVAGQFTNFDINFMKQLLDEFEIPFNYHHCIIDMSNLYYVLMGSYKSDSIFDFLGFDIRDKHDALEDAYLTLEAIKLASQLLY